MIIKELIQKPSIEEIVKEFMRIAEIDPEKHSKATVKITELIDKLSKYEETPTDDTLFVIKRNTEDEFEKPIVIYDVFSYIKEELDYWYENTDLTLKMPSENEVNAFDMEEIEQLTDKIKPPSSCSIMFSLWKDTLGLNINEKNLKEIGEITYVTAYLMELTFYGFDEENLVKERERIDEAMREVEEGTGKTYTEDEVDDFLDEIFKDDRTQEEKESDRLKIARDWLIDNTKMYELLK